MPRTGDHVFRRRARAPEAPALWPLRPTLALPVPTATHEGHADTVTCVSVLPVGSASRDQGQHCASGTSRSGATLRCLQGHGDWVTCVVVLAGGQRALSGSKDGTLRLWDIESGQRTALPEGHEEPVTSVAILPGGRHALSGIPRRHPAALGHRLGRRTAAFRWAWRCWSELCRDAAGWTARALQGRTTRPCASGTSSPAPSCGVWRSRGSVLCVAVLADGQRSLWIRRQDAATAGHRIRYRAAMLRGPRGMGYSRRRSPRWAARPLGLRRQQTFVSWDLGSSVELRRFGDRIDEDAPPPENKVTSVTA